MIRVSMEKAPRPLTVGAAHPRRDFVNNNRTHRQRRCGRREIPGSQGLECRGGARGATLEGHRRNGATMADKVIFACVHNAGRSQMAAAFFNALADPDKAHAVSAGTEPGERVHPEVQAVMKEVGIDLSGAKPQKLTEELAKGAQLLITMGCGDKCP